MRLRDGRSGARCAVAGTVRLGFWKYRRKPRRLIGEAGGWDGEFEQYGLRVGLAAVCAAEPGLDTLEQRGRAGLFGRRVGVLDLG